MSKNTMVDFEKWFDKPHGECWLWKGSRMKSYGYGRFSLNGKRWRSHVLSYIAYIGEIPKGLHVLHKCDVTNCVNPDHLFLGTQADNNSDRASKGRTRGNYQKGQFVGSNHPQATITESIAKNIKSLLEENEINCRAIARKFNIPKHIVYNIKYQKSWSHV